MLANTYAKYKLPKVIKFSKRGLDFSNEDFKNLASINGIDYAFSYLNNNPDEGIGGNSYVYALNLAQDEEEDDVPNHAIKICKKPVWNSNFYRASKIHKRFDREITALNECKEKNYSNIIEIIDFGCFIRDNNAYLFYIMEYADSDLKSYLSNQNEDNLLNYNDRVGVCIDIANSIKSLHDLGIYHRDIKPENILMLQNMWKLGDLGLIDYRQEDTKIDYEKEFIGPKGWTTPEAMNKYLSETNTIFNYDTAIDNKSDIFQLGMLFWFILQENAPIGCIKPRDFKYGGDELYTLIRQMLNHTKKKRPNSIDEIIHTLNRTYHSSLST